MKRRALCALALGAALIPLAAAPQVPAKPMHIMSLNECTDLLLLQLVAKYRIASVTYRAHGAIGVVQPGLDAGVAVSHGSPEEIAAERPDLILAGDFSLAVTKSLARLSGARLLEVKSANNFDDIRQITRQVGAAVGEPARAEALIAQMDATLAGLAASAPAKPYSVAAWSAGNVPGRKTLANAIIEAAGAVNVAAKRDDEDYSSFSVEELLKARPDILMFGVVSAKAPSLTDSGSQNRVVRQLYAHREVTYPETLYNCGVPQSARAAADLRRALAAAATGMPR